LVKKRWFWLGKVLTLLSGGNGFESFKGETEKHGKKKYY